ncbi:hypothetical protein ACSBR2_024729 [Camellia fascicularis]
MPQPPNRPRQRRLHWPENLPRVPLRIHHRTRGQNRLRPMPELIRNLNNLTKVKARLSNPSPKIQAVKGGMCGGFRIGHGGARSFSKFGRGFGRGGHAFNRPNFQRGRGFYQHGRGQTWRMGFSHEHDLGNQYPPSHRREVFGRGGRRDLFGSSHDASGGNAVPARPNLDRIRLEATDSGRGRHIPVRRQPFSPEEGFNGPFVGRTMILITWSLADLDLD